MHKIEETQPNIEKPQILNPNEKSAKSKQKLKENTLEDIPWRRECRKYAWIDGVLNEIVIWVENGSEVVMRGKCLWFEKLSQLLYKIENMHFSRVRE